MGETVGVPTFSGIKEAAIDYALGAAGALAVGISSGIFGNGLIGSVISAALAGSLIKGVRGEIIATVMGFMGVMSMFGSGANAEASNSRGVM